MNFNKQYEQYWKSTGSLAKNLKGFCKEHAKKIADQHLEDILAINGIEAVRIVVSGSPEDTVTQEIKISIKISDEYEEKQSGDYFNLYGSGLEAKIEDILEDEYTESRGVFLTKNWEISKPSYWEELVAEAGEIED